ncbi:MAG: hypothetical protein ACTHWW_11500 [Arthrobacter sp.]|uniref:hypothetical protein n=1 Tax=unclassified Arthrobacter TaxID=235627 RepID=UPI00264C2EE4|nr:hypothetical protein [Micrococcaceae bacterium]MDN5813522.1 hypothetical protein [Micrococcaceae bacterium]MDN5825315.1 hypothetical protein [Micrococcaceae bacterium]MDN5880406.1 hypothetical protein [Micrococcaceae bacterium]MDN5887812.1 hypothetical protein [Micrococcaceae bacterium]
MMDPIEATEVTALLQPGRPFAAPELMVLRAEGVLRQVLPGTFVCSAVEDGPALRAAAVATVAGPRLHESAVIGRLAAAWVHGFHPAPEVLELLVSRFHRIPLQRGPVRLALHECVLEPSEVQGRFAMPVTTPVRTGLDVAFHGGPAVARQVLSRLTGPRSGGCSRQELLSAIEATGRRPGKRAAWDLVAGLPSLAAVPR